MILQAVDAVRVHSWAEVEAMRRRLSVCCF
jgi:hypothetical protein